MTNLHITNAEEAEEAEEISALKWIAAMTLIAALVAAAVLGQRGTQLVDVDPVAVPPIAVTPPNT